MANNRMTELEAMLYRQLDDQKKATDDLLKAVNIRNWERVEEQKNDYNASQTRNKVMMMGLLAAGAVGAIIFYKITFGIFCAWARSIGMRCCGIWSSGKQSWTNSVPAWDLI